MLDDLKIGYVPYSLDLSNPADRRRFPFYARERGIRWETAHPAGSYDVVVLSSKADLVAWMKRPRKSTRLIYEVVDGHFAIPGGNPRWLVRGVAKYIFGELSQPVMNYRTLMEHMCQQADAVVCGTPEQRLGILQWARNVHVILDSHDELGDAVKVDYDADASRVNLVWEGLPYTIDGLRLLKPVLQGLRDEFQIVLHVITARETPRLGVNHFPRPTQKLLDEIVPGSILHRWDQGTLPGIVTSCDIGVIPIDLSDPLAAAKPENKLLILWRLGLPVVTSATPAYQRCMEGCGIDLSCAGMSDWRWKLGEIMRNKALRTRAASAGRRYVAEHHSKSQLLAQWDRLFASVLESGSMHS